MTAFADPLPLWTLRQWVENSAQAFEQAELYYGHGTDNAIDEAVYLIKYALDSDFEFSDRDIDAIIDSTEAAKIRLLVSERINTRKPAAYLVNEAWFAGLPFYVNEHVLVPRSPFAELIHDGFSPWVDINVCRNALEIGTGSGCIGIAMAHYFPELNMDITDVSDEAIDIAKRNVTMHKLQQRVNIIKSDIFNNLPDKKYDLIVSNPPYVDEEDMSQLPEEYRHEPELGLAAGKTGLDCVSRILEKAGAFLTDEGVLIVEVGNSQQHVINAYPELAFTWLEFEYGGSGVFLLDASQLK